MSTDEMHDQPIGAPSNEPSNEPNDQQLPGLVPEDRAAIDALIDSRASSSENANSDQTLISDPRIERAGRLLDLLGASAGPADRALVDLTYLRVMRASEAPEAQLESISADGLDAWVQGGFDAANAPASLRDQATQHEHLAALCTAPMPGESDGRSARIDRTLSTIQEQIDTQSESLRLDRRRGGLSSLRLSDVISIAAMLLLATAVVLPVLNSVRQTQQVELCRSNFAGVGGAFGMYANSNASALPMASAGLGGTWLDVGSTPERSNSANLYLLVRTNHVQLEQLACPGNPEAPTVRLASNQTDWRRLEEVSYSYQVTPRGANPSWGGGGGQSRIVMADRSPVILRIVRGDTVYPEANSTNHAGEGQHALTSDGSTQWLESPVVEGDNIWLPRVAEEGIRDARAKLGLRGDERPTSDRDVFLAP